MELKARADDPETQLTLTQPEVNQSVAEGPKTILKAYHTFQIQRALLSLNRRDQEPHRLLEATSTETLTLN